MTDSKICKKCGRILPIERFRIKTGSFYNPYYSGQCIECEATYDKEYRDKKRKEFKFSANTQILIERKYKTIPAERILDMSDIDIPLLGEDEIFVRMIDYQDIWISNYGRMIRYQNSKYSLLNGDKDAYGAIRYSAKKNVFVDGKWKYVRSAVYATRAVVDTFIVNQDKANNINVWHKNFDKSDNYYKNLYPLNYKQYKVVKRKFLQEGDVSEEFIIKVMNDIHYKLDDWSMDLMKPIMCGVGYKGSEDVDCKSEAYLRWHDMLNRCYNEEFLERQPQYRGCSVCEEWLNFSNFKLWYEENKKDEIQRDLDKDILIKGNKVYSPETCCLVPHDINTLFLTAKKRRGDFPIGVYFDTDGGKFRASMNFMGQSIKLGSFDTAEAAFARYKEYKEDFIEDMAEQYNGRIPDKVYRAMLNWKIEITD